MRLALLVLLSCIIIASYRSYPILVMNKIYQLTCSLLLATSMTLEAADRPNLVIIYGDDVGYGDVSAYGSKMPPTPNIDKMVSEGLMFTDGHCSAATCTPSRFSMLTGVHGFRSGVRIFTTGCPFMYRTRQYHPS